MLIGIIWASCFAGAGKLSHIAHVRRLVTALASAAIIILVGVKPGFNENKISVTINIDVLTVPAPHHRHGIDSGSGTERTSNHVCIIK